MKNFFKVIGIIALVAVIGFSMVSCGGDEGGGSTNPKWPTELLGKWSNSDGNGSIRFKHNFTSSGDYDYADFYTPSWLDGGGNHILVSIEEGGTIKVTRLDVERTLCTSYTITGTGADRTLTLTGGDDFFSVIMDKEFFYDE